MAVDRRTPTLANDGPTMDGEDYTDLVNEEVEALWDRAAVWLDNVAGTNTITATADPTVLAYSRNQQYNFLPVNNNTGPTTIAIDGLAAISIRDIDGVALAADSLVAGRMTRLQHDGTNFRILNRPPDTGVDAISEVAIQSFTATGTYTPNARMIFCKVQIQGAGGGSGGADSNGSVTVKSGCGGGGEYAEGYFDAATIGASQAVTIGTVGTAGNTSGSNGGNATTTSLGSLLTAAGGSGGEGTGSASSSQATRNGGAGGTGGTGGTLRIPGGRGGDASSSGGGSQVIGTSGDGFLGHGTPASGAGGANYGAGGAGVSTSSSSGLAGNVGGAALVYITEYLRAA